MSTHDREANLSALIKKQRSHVLFVLSHPVEGEETAFLQWYQGAYRNAVSNFVDVLSVQQYERHQVDITRGRYAPLPFQYLELHELSIDGAEQAQSLIEEITALHREQASAQPPATWLYYPAGEKVGRSPAMKPSMLTLAFANAVSGKEGEFSEWYVTRHIRHALNISALVSGQCFARTQFQLLGIMDAAIAMIAVYEQEGPPESILASLASLPKGTFAFPAVESAPGRFAEWVYRPL